MDVSFAHLQVILVLDDFDLVLYEGREERKRGKDDSEFDETEPLSSRFTCLLSFLSSSLFS